MVSQNIPRSEFQDQDIINITDTTGLGYQPWANGLAEWTKITSIFAHRPGIETSLASLDFKTNLFLDVFYLEKAQAQHDNLSQTLRDQDIEVITSENLAEYLRPQDLRNFVSFNERFDDDDILELLENYIEDHKQLDVLLTKPVISRKGEKEHNVTNTFMLSNPLGNFFYARDPIFQTGPNSFVLSNLKYKVRRRESEVINLLFNKINDYLGRDLIDIIYSVPSSETIEGGESIPIGDAMIIGVESQRTSMGAVVDLMENNALGHSSIAIPISPVRTLEEMHIDTWLNVIDEDLFIGSKRFLNKGVEMLLYHRNEERAEYRLDKEYVDLKDYLTNHREMEMIGLEEKEQKDLMSNGLAIGPRKFIMIDGKKSSPTFIRRLEQHDVEVIPVELDELTDGHGGAHCMTQPVEREIDRRYLN